jgi:CheY-like chemotaxis protein
MHREVHATPRSPNAALNGTTILVVEDEELVREMIVSELEDAGYLVLEAGSAHEALSILEDRHVTILFTDIRMPGTLDGWDLAEEAHRRDPGIKVLYTTGYSQERPRLVPNSLYVQKPYRASQVLAAIERLANEAEGGPSAS